jgi:hypothetical protein
VRADEKLKMNLTKNYQSRFKILYVFILRKNKIGHGHARVQGHVIGARLRGRAICKPNLRDYKYSDLNDKFHFCVKSIFTFLPASIGPVKTGPCFSAAMLAKI